ncbi:MAG: hypothetical protein ACYDHD_00120 [Vulcanimicrobiaceae bacterium]
MLCPTILGLGIMHGHLSAVTPQGVHVLNLAVACRHQPIPKRASHAAAIAIMIANATLRVTVIDHGDARVTVV